MIEDLSGRNLMVPLLLSLHFPPPPLRVGRECKERETVRRWDRMTRTISNRPSPSISDSMSRAAPVSDVAGRDRVALAPYGRFTPGCAAY